MAADLSHLSGFSKTALRAYFCIMEVAVSANRCSIIQGCRICNYMEENCNSSYPPTLLTLQFVVICKYDSETVTVSELKCTLIPSCSDAWHLACHVKQCSVKLYKKYSGHHILLITSLYNQPSYSPAVHSCVINGGWNSTKVRQRHDYLTAHNPPPGCTSLL